MDYSQARGASVVEVHTAASTLDGANTSTGDLRYISDTESLYIRHSNAWHQIGANAATTAESIAFAIALG